MELNIQRDDWIIEKLGEFAISKKGKKPKNQSDIQTEVYQYPYVDIKGFEQNIFDSYTDGVKCNFCTEDDFLMVWDGSRSGLVGKAVDGAIGSTLVKINLPQIEDHFAYYFLKSKYLEINTNAKGTGTPHVNPDLLWNYNFPIVPLLEQKAIVSKIEQLFSELDNGIENLKTAQHKLKIYRQAVLKKAFNGELTKEWREQQTDLSTASKLREEIKREQEKYYKKQIEEWEEEIKKWKQEASKDKKPSKPTKIKKPFPITNDIKKLLFNLPKNWLWIQSGELFSYVTSGSRGWAKHYAQSGSIFVRMTNLNHNTLKLDLQQSKIQYLNLPDNTEGKRTKIKKDDFLFSITAELGMFAIAPEFKEAYVNQHVSLARPLPINHKKYLGYWIISKFGGHFFLNYKQKGATKAGLGLDEIREFPIPICSEEEQNQIVQEIESRLSVCDNIETTLTDALQKSEALRQSILKKAFEGKLLTKKELEDIKNNPEYESAEKLLERIQQERDK